VHRVKRIDNQVQQHLEALNALPEGMIYFDDFLVNYRVSRNLLRLR
jgi:hypothetical protein